MKAKDLKLENLIETETFNVGFNKVTVSSLAYGIINNKPESHFYPVQITEEILIDFGFRKRKGSMYNGSRSYWFEKCFKGFYFISNDIGEHGFSKKLQFISVSLSYDDSDFPDRIKHVHILQNTYKELTGKDLIQRSAPAIPAGSTIL